MAPAWISPLADVIAGLQAAIDPLHRGGQPRRLPLLHHRPARADRDVGLKAAQLVLSDAADVDRCAPSVPCTDTAPPPSGYLASTAAHDSGGEWLDGVLDHLDGNRQPEGTYPAWLDCRALGLPGPAGQFFLDRAGVALVEGGGCRAPGEGHVRLDFATGRGLLTTMVDRMAAAARVP